MIVKFLFRCFIFIVLALCGLAAFAALMNTQRPKLYNMNEAHILFLGNSHIETSVNDSLLSGARNFARSSETMLHIYPKLKLARQNNQRLDTVFLCMDNTLLFNYASHHEQMSPSFFDQYGISDYWALLTKGKFEEITQTFSHPFDLKNNFDYVVAARSNKWDIRQSNAIGGYLYLKRDKLAEDIIRRGHRDGVDETPAPLAVYFLERIVDYCRENDIKLYFICAPQHPKMSWRRECYRRFAAENYPELTLLDYMDYKLPDSCFGDLDHLNHRGAVFFSKFLEDSVLHKPIPRQ